MTEILLFLAGILVGTGSTLIVSMLVLSSRTGTQLRNEFHKVACGEERRRFRTYAKLNGVLTSPRL